MLMMQDSVELYFFVDLRKKKNKQDKAYASHHLWKGGAYTRRRHFSNRVGPSQHTKKILYSTVIHTFSL